MTTESELNKTVVLHDGRVVSSSSREYALECEARYLLNMPLEERRKGLANRDRIRGVQATDRLREVMKALHEQRRRKRVLSTMQSELPAGKDLPG